MLWSLRYGIALAALGAVAGCSDSGTASRMADQSMTSTQLAAYAGAHTFPATQPVDGQLHLVALYDRANGLIKLYNFGHDALKDMQVWVNGSYVAPVHALSPNNSVILKTSDLYNSSGNTLASTGGPVSRVLVQMGDQLYSVEGPAAD